MKIRYIAFIYTIILLTIIVGSYFVYIGKETGSIDMVYYNKQLNQISIDIEKGINISTIENNYQCYILVMSDSDYESNLNERLLEGDIVLDLYSKEQYIGKIAWDTEAKTYLQRKKQLFDKYALLCMILLAIGYFSLWMVYHNYVRPFRKLQAFSHEI